jgi:hypothetical protein
MVIFGITGTASADLVSRNLNHPGDNLLTLDTATGLEWLNVPLTANVSYDAVSAGFGGYATTLGFRYATTADIATLFSDAGVVQGNIWGYWNFGNPYYLASDHLISLLGVTHPFDGLSVCTMGFTAGAGGAFDCINSHADSIAFAVWPGFPYGPSDSAADVGSFLVRTANQSPVPEPSDLALLGTGLGIIGMFRRKFTSF